MKSQSHGGSSGSGSSTGGKGGDDATFASEEAVIDQKVGETVSDTSSTKDSGKSTAVSNNDFSGNEVLKAKTFDVSGREGVASLLIENDRQTVSRSLSPGGEVKGPNKRPALICDFYAKGWCIKGSSCRFLHVKDRQKSDLPQQVGHVPTDCEREGQLEVLREGSRGSGLPSIPDPLAASAGNEGSNRFPDVPKFLRRDELFPLASKDVESEITKQNGFAGEYGDGSAVSSTRQFRNPPSHLRSVEELARLQQQRPYNYTIPILGDSPGPSSSVALSAGGVLSSNGISAWKGSSLPFSYSSLSASHVGPRSSSLLHCPSQISGSKPDNLPPTNRKICSDDWEPSAPFQPSILLRSMMPLPEGRSDPLQDSVELPKVGDTSLKAFCSQGSSIVNTSNHQNNGEAVSENRGLPFNDDTMSVSSHNTHHEKDKRTSEVEVVGTSTDWQNRVTPKSLGSSDVKDVTDTTSDARRQKHGPRGSLHVKAEIVGQNNLMNAGNATELSVNKESKALRQFRVALIEFVKDSLKPKWREGRLSKDAHNKIVKKAVEKVLSTLPDDQVPISMEMVKQYLALSRGKIDKLVEGYAEVYGKA